MRPLLGEKVTPEQAVNLLVMHLVAAVVCVVAVVIGSVIAVAHPARAVGWWLIAVSALSFPLSSRVLEGPVLLSFGAHHGLTLSDVVGLVGFIVGVFTVWPPVSWHGTERVLVRSLALVVLLGLAIAGGSDSSSAAQPAGSSGHGHAGVVGRPASELIVGAVGRCHAFPHNTTITRSRPRD